MFGRGHESIPRSRARHRARASGALALGLVIALGACGGSSKSESAATLLQKGLQEARAGKLDDAKDHFRAVLEQDPQNIYAHYNLGYIAQTKGDRAEAEKEYALALATDHNYEPALYNLANAVAADGNMQAAIGYLRRAIGVNDNDANAHFNIGLLLRRTGQSREGNLQIQYAVQLDPSLAAAARAHGVQITRPAK
jgi:tetratricopeptide (TPR) repeat protein